MEDLCFKLLALVGCAGRRGAVGGREKLYRCIISDEMSAVETMDEAVQNIWQLCLASLEVIKNQG